NPLYEESSMQAITEIYGCIGSDAYQYKIRDNYFQTIQLYPYHSSQIQPIQGEKNWIECYRYNNGAGYIIDLDVSDVLRFRWNSVDFNRPYKSIGPLVAGANEVDIDNDRAMMAKALLANGAVPAFFLELSENATIRDANGNPRPPTQGQLDRLGERMQERFGTKNRGKGAIVPNGTKLHRFGFSPREMVTNDFVTIPETRLASLMGVPIQMTSLYSAKDAKTYANYSESKKSLYEDTMLPRWHSFGRVYTHGFKDELFKGDKRKYIVKYDHSEVPALQDSQESLRQATQDEFTKGLRTLDEAREDLGLKPDKQYGDEYFWELSGTSAALYQNAAPEAQEFNQEQAEKLARYIDKSGRGTVHRNGVGKKVFAT
ncbi:MAG: phage portal protein, partial [Patescibacteria group bacterium]|nr:phage portal protein [Patescibacteria group bacterium]